MASSYLKCVLSCWTRTDSIPMVFSNCHSLFVMSTRGRLVRFRFRLRCIVRRKSLSTSRTEWLRHVVPPRCGHCVLSGQKPCSYYELPRNDLVLTVSHFSSMSQMRLSTLKKRVRNPLAKLVAPTHSRLSVSGSNPSTATPRSSCTFLEALSAGHFPGSPIASRGSVSHDRADSAKELNAKGPSCPPSLLFSLY